MAANSGRPNRKFLSYCRRSMFKLAYSDARFLITSSSRIAAAGVGILTKRKFELNVDYSGATLSFVNEVRHINSAFKQLTDEELTIDGIFIIARKSG